MTRLSDAQFAARIHVDHCGCQVELVDQRCTGAYPEHDKLALVSKHSQRIGEYFETHTVAEWWHVDRYDEDAGHRAEECPGDCELVERLMPVLAEIQTLLAGWFDIDQVALEQEKRQMLDELRSRA